MYKAIISLAPGQVGFYDEMSKIHLSLQNKNAKVLNNVPLSGLIRGVQEGKIIVVSGSLDSGTANYKEGKAMLPTYYRLLDAKRRKELREQDMPIVKIEEKEEVVSPKVPVVEESVEAPVDEEKPKTRRTKKKKDTEKAEE